MHCNNVYYSVCVCESEICVSMCERYGKESKYKRRGMNLSLRDFFLLEVEGVVVVAPFLTPLLRPIFFLPSLFLDESCC